MPFGVVAACSADGHVGCSLFEMHEVRAIQHDEGDRGLEIRDFAVWVLDSVHFVQRKVDTVSFMHLQPGGAV